MRAWLGGYPPSVCMYVCVCEIGGEVLPIGRRKHDSPGYVWEETTLGFAGRGQEDNGPNEDTSVS